jgi:hypothetical protein
MNLAKVIMEENRKIARSESFLPGIQATAWDSRG